jgi:DNA polymerase-3 subunit delta
MEMKDLKKQIKENNIGKLYLFTGPEQFLVRYYENEIVNKLLDENSKAFNYTVIGNKTSLNELSDVVSTFPAFSERRVVIVKDSSLAKGSGDKNWNTFFESLPGYICLIFILDVVDKRTAFFKSIEKHGFIVEFKKQGEAALVKWVTNVFASYGKHISKAEADFFVSMLEPDMTLLRLEIEKVVSYMGDKTDVSHEDILNVVTKSVKTRIFDLTDAVSQNQTAKAIRIIDDLLQIKEPVHFIVAMLSRHLGILIKIKRLEEKKIPQSEMAKTLGIPSFIIGKTRKQASFFSIDTLKQLIRECMETDLAIKSGKMNPRLALELFILKWKQHAFSAS